MFLSNKKNRIICIVSVIIVIIACVLFLFRGEIEELFAPSVTLISPEPIEASDRTEIVIDVKLSDLPERMFPAGSISVEFDKNKLEYLGVKQGTMMTLGDSTGEDKVYNIPIWKDNINIANENGIINAMYLDITGGKYAYVKEGFSKENKDVLLRLTFRLRDSVVSGEIYNITIRDAVMATVENSIDNTSLATSNRTLKAYHAKIVVK